MLSENFVDRDHSLNVFIFCDTFNFKVSFSRFVIHHSQLSFFDYTYEEDVIFYEGKTVDFVGDARLVEEGVQLSYFETPRVYFHDKQSFIGSYCKYIFFSRALEIKDMGLLFEFIVCFQYEGGFYFFH